jgi:hypothetical protein
MATDSRTIMQTGRFRGKTGPDVRNVLLSLLLSLLRQLHSLWVALSLMDRLPGGYLLAVVAVVFQFCTPLSVAAAVYRCVGSDGSTSYSDTPCATNAAHVEVETSTDRTTTAAGPVIRNASYSSPRNGRSIDVTNQLRSLCQISPGTCVVSCGNQLAGDPDFGQRKYCKISYQCGAGRSQELQIQEGETSTLGCASAAAVAKSPQPAQQSQRVASVVNSPQPAQHLAAASAITGSSPPAQRPLAAVSETSPSSPRGLNSELKIKPGLWEVNKTDSLALSPQLAKRICLTQDMLARGVTFPIPQLEHASCGPVETAQQGSATLYRRRCTIQETAVSQTIQVSANGNSIIETIDAHPLSVNTIVRSEERLSYLGPVCPAQYKTLPEDVHIERQDILTFTEVAPHVVVADHRGGYIVAGQSAGTAPYSADANFEEWAAKLDSTTGSKAWEVQHAKSPDGPNGITARVGYNGVVVMPNDSVFLCGTQLRKHASKAILTHLDANGKELEQIHLRPQQANEADESALDTCLPWNDGFVVIGSAAKTGWLVKFDRDGRFQWEKRGDGYYGDEAIAAADGGLFTIHHTMESSIVRINSRGDVIASRTEHNEAHFVRELKPTEEPLLYSFDPDASRGVNYQVLNDRLQATRTTSSDMFGTNKAYQLADGTYAFFGGTGGGNTTAAVGRRLPDSQVVVAHRLSPEHQSGWFIDATPAENPNEFVAIRTIVSLYPGSPGWPGSPGYPRSSEAAKEFFGNRLVIARIRIEK